MALPLHIAIALISVVYTTYVFFAPTRPRLTASYWLAGATAVSGFYLVVTTSVNMLHTCLSGLLYTGIVTVGILAAQHRLATVKQRTQTRR